MREPYYAGGGTPFDWVPFNGYGRPPHTSVSVGARNIHAGPNGVAVGAFAWVDPETGDVSNSQIEGVLGFVLPVNRIGDPFETTRSRANGFPQLLIRASLACVVAATGDFDAFFPAGANAGAQVFADPATGLPYTVNPNQSYVPTPWTACRDCRPLSRARISTSIKPFN